MGRFKFSHRERGDEGRRRPAEKDELTCAQRMRIIAMVYTTLSLLMIPLGFVFIVRATLLALRGLHAATTRNEKNYWRLSLAAHLMFAYAVLLLTALTVDSMLGEPWNLVKWWPSILRHWGRSEGAAITVLLDVLATLCAAFCSICLSRCFGRIDENNVWHPSERLNRNGKTNDAVRRERRARLRTPK